MVEGHFTEVKALDFAIPLDRYQHETGIGMHSLLWHLKEISVKLPTLGRTSRVNSALRHIHPNESFLHCYVLNFRHYPPPWVSLVL